MSGMQEPIAIYPDFLEWKRDLKIRAAYDAVDQYIFDEQVYDQVLAARAERRALLDRLDYDHGLDPEATLVAALASLSHDSDSEFDGVSQRGTTLASTPSDVEHVDLTEQESEIVRRLDSLRRYKGAPQQDRRLVYEDKKEVDRIIAMDKKAWAKLARGLVGREWDIIQGKTAREAYLALEEIHKYSIEVAQSRAQWDYISLRFGELDTESVQHFLSEHRRLAARCQDLFGPTGEFDSQAVERNLLSKLPEEFEYYVLSYQHNPETNRPYYGPLSSRIEQHIVRPSYIEKHGRRREPNHADARKRLANRSGPHVANSKERKCWNCGSITHSVGKCTAPGAENRRNNILEAKRHRKKPASEAPADLNDVWILSSRSTSHFTHRKDWLSNYKTIPPFALATVSGDLRAAGVGSVLVETDLGNITFSKVHYVPGLKNNLLSFTSIQDRGADILCYSDGHVLIVHEKNVIATAKRVGQLIHLCGHSRVVG